MCFNIIVLCVQVYGCFYILTTDNFKGTIVATERTVRGRPDGGNCDVPEYAGNLLISDKHISHL
jgi:hypothetical protein